MKNLKLLSRLMVLVMLLCLSACDGSDKQDRTGGDTVITTTTTKEVGDAAFQPISISYPITMSFSSGVGAWYSSITIHEDGTFVGEYHDQEMGAQGDEYSNGTRIYSFFSGNFIDIKQIDADTFSLTIENITTEHEWEYSYIEDGFRYVATYPVGLVEYVDGEAEIVREYLLYIPGTKTNTLPEEFLSWSTQYVNEKIEALSGYALMNTKTYDGFFQ